MPSRLIQPAIWENTCDRCGDVIPQRAYPPHEICPIILRVYAYGNEGRARYLCMNCTIMFFDVFMQSGDDAH